MARLQRKALKAHKKKHEAWQKYANKELAAGRKPTKFKDWETAPVYYGATKQTTESRLKAAGMSTKQINRLKRSRK